MQINFNSQTAFGQIPVLRAITSNSEEMVVSKLEASDAQDEKLMKSLRKTFQHHSSVLSKSQSDRAVKSDFASGNCYLLQSKNEDGTTSMRGFAVCTKEMPQRANINEMYLTDTFGKLNPNTGEQAIFFVVAGAKDKNVRTMSANQLPSDFKTTTRKMYKDYKIQSSIQSANGKSFIDAQTVKMFSDAIGANRYKLYLDA